MWAPRQPELWHPVWAQQDTKGGPLHHTTKPTMDDCDEGLDGCNDVVQLDYCATGHFCLSIFR
jgi:hypothetical protein